MSQENVELIRRGHEAFRDSGEEAIFEYLDADIELTPVAELLDSETYHGHEGVRHYFQTMREAFGDFGWEPQEFVDLGDHVLVATRFFAEGAVAECRWKRWSTTSGPSDAGRPSGYLATWIVRGPSKPPGCRSRPEALSTRSSRSGPASSRCPWSARRRKPSTRRS
jgi:ketosteroid isomerase-like protein